MHIFMNDSLCIQCHNCDLSTLPCGWETWPHSRSEHWDGDHTGMQDQVMKKLRERGRERERERGVALPLQWLSTCHQGRERDMKWASCEGEREGGKEREGERRACYDNIVPEGWELWIQSTHGHQRVGRHNRSAITLHGDHCVCMVGRKTPDGHYSMDHYG